VKKFRHAFCSCELDLEPIYELDLEILKMYLIKKELFRSRLSEVGTVQTDTETDRQTDVTENITTPHSRVAKIYGKQFNLKFTRK